MTHAPMSAAVAEESIHAYQGKDFLASGKRARYFFCEDAFTDMLDDLQKPFLSFVIHVEREEAILSTDIMSKFTKQEGKLVTHRAEEEVEHVAGVYWGARRGTEES